MEEVKNPKDLADECRKLLHKLLGSDYVYYRKMKRSRRLSYLFAGAGATKAETGSRSYQVIPFCRTEVKTYWLATSLDILIDQGFRLANISLVVFEGYATDNMKTPILRAEWDSEYSDLRNIHAQPHWHVYSDSLTENISVESIEFNPMSDTKPFIPGSIKQQDTNNGFHFAMASQWHLNGISSHISNLEKKGLIKWLDGCLNYIRNQLLSYS